MSGAGSRAGVSVVVPTHDRDFTLDLAIASIQAQTVRDIEIIIVGDGITPAVRGVVDRLLARDDRIRFLDFEKAPGRGYENRHRALMASTGEFVFYSDDDDLWLPDHVEKLCRALSAAEVADSAVLSIARSGRVHRAFANHSWPTQREQLASTGDRKIIFDTHIAHRRSLYFRLRDGWGRGVSSLLSAFAASDAIWATFNGPTALSLHGSVRKQDSSSQRRDEALRFAGNLTAGDLGPAAIGVWYLYRMLERVPPGSNECLRSYLDRMGIAECGVADGEIATGQPIAPGMTAAMLADMELAFGLFRQDIADDAPLHRILLPLVEPLLGGAARIRHFAKAIGKLLPPDRALQVVAEISEDRRHDIELKTLLRAQLLLMQRNAKEALPLLEEGAKAFARYGADATLMAARQLVREGQPDEAVRSLLDAFERFGARSDVRLALANALWRAGRAGEAVPLLEAVPDNTEAAALLVQIRTGEAPSHLVEHQRPDLSGALLENMRSAFGRREWDVTVSVFEQISALSKVGKGRRVEAATLAARARIALGERPAARRLLKEFAGVVYDKPQHYGFLALAYLELRNFREAARYCRLADQSEQEVRPRPVGGILA